LSKNISSQRP